MKKKIIIIGGSGRLGSNLINNLKKNYEIFNLSPENNNNKYVKYIKFDLSKTISIKDFFKRNIIDADCIINCTRFRSLSKKENIKNFEKTIDIEIKNYFFFLEEYLKKKNTKIFLF